MFRDIVDNKIAAGEVGKDLRRVADTLVETVTETEKTVDKNVSPLMKGITAYHCRFSLLY